MMEDPTYSQFLATEGHSVPAYAYALNNPLGFIDPEGLYECVQGANCDFDPKMEKALECFDKCTKRDTKITCGKNGHDGKKDPHNDGEGVDVGGNANADLTPAQAEQCFQECFPEGFGQQEKNGGPGTHFHMQTRPGKGGRKGWKPDVQPNGQ